MGIDRDDPRLTSYALGEMSDDERTAFEKLLATDPSAEAEVKAIASLGRDLEAELDRTAPSGLGEARRGEVVAAVGASQRSQERTGRLRVVEGEGEGTKKTTVVPLQRSPVRWRALSTVSALAVAAAALFFVVSKKTSMSGSRGSAADEAPEAAAASSARAKSDATTSHGHYASRVASAPADDKPAAPSKGAPTDGTLAPAAVASNAPCDVHDPMCAPRGSPSGPSFLSATSAPTSTFTLDVEPTMGGIADALHAGALPPPSSVDIAGMVNAYHYVYPTPNEGYAIATDVASAPWDPSHRLLRIGVQGPALAPLPRVDGGLVSVAFDPRVVVGYRFLGGEPGGVGSDTDGRVLPTRASVTALYELTTRANGGQGTKEHLGDVSLRYAAAGGELRTVTTSANDAGASIEAASDDFRFAAGVAGFGLLLSGTAGARFSYEDVLRLVQSAHTTEVDGSRKAFVDMVERAKTLSKK